MINKVVDKFKKESLNNLEGFDPVVTSYLFDHSNTLWTKPITSKEGEVLNSITAIRDTMGKQFLDYVKDIFTTYDKLLPMMKTFVSKNNLKFIGDKKDLSSEKLKKYDDQVVSFDEIKVYFKALEKSLEFYLENYGDLKYLITVNEDTEEEIGVIPLKFITGTIKTTQKALNDWVPKFERILGRLEWESSKRINQRVNIEKIKHAEKALKEKNHTTKLDKMKRRNLLIEDIMITPSIDKINLFLKNFKFDNHDQGRLNKYYKENKTIFDYDTCKLLKKNLGGRYIKKIFYKMGKEK